MFIYNHKTIWLTLVLATFAIFSQWEFLIQGTYALGLNTTAFLLLGWLLLLSERQTPLTKHDLLWLIPLWLMAASFALFTNPWLKTITLFTLPLVTGLIYNYRQIQNPDTLTWNRQLLRHLTERTLAPLRYLDQATSALTSQFKVLSKNTQNPIIKRITLGILILIPLAALVLSLLSSADEKFLKFVSAILENLIGAFDLTTIIKLILIIPLTILLLSLLPGWHKPQNYTQKIRETKNLDDIITGIVLTGILVIYLIFLTFQLDYLTPSTLPTEFKATERIVKSGFWQLIALTILNAILFFIVYKRTTTLVQILLRAFILASSLVLLSACWRLAMYVYWYGLSYEKFFASVTVLYALMLFGYLTLATFQTNRKNIFKFIAITALWFYGIATISPIEKIIFNTNVYLSQKSDTRINLHELSDLSADILTNVEQGVATGLLNDTRWRDWLHNNKTVPCSLSWYEKNLSLLMQCTSPKSQSI